MIYVIDHNDSFTHNVVHQFSLFDEVECDNYNEINKKNLQKARVIVFSFFILTDPGIQIRDKSLRSMSTIILCSFVSLMFFLKY